MKDVAADGGAEVAPQDLIDTIYLQSSAPQSKLMVWESREHKEALVLKEFLVEDYQIYYSSSHPNRRIISLRENGKYVADLIFVASGDPLPPDTDVKADGTRIKMYFRPNDFDPLLKILNSGEVVCYFNKEGTSADNGIRTKVKAS